jgi:hypothetical protein
MQEIAFPGFKFKKFSCMVCRPHTWPSAIAIALIYYLTERSLFKGKSTGKSLKNALAIK